MNYVFKNGLRHYISDGRLLTKGLTNISPPTVWLSKNGTVQQNVNKVLELAGGIDKYIDSTDIVILKCSAQWPHQGYTNTECIKYVIDAILGISGFSGEIIICDNIQNVVPNNTRGFWASAANRNYNWADYNWEELATYYQGLGDPVAIFPWVSGPLDAGELDGGITNGSEGAGWVRKFFSMDALNIYLSSPCFESPLTPGRIIDLKNGVYESGVITGRRVKTIVMATLNNHGWASEDYAGVTSAIKSVFGATEIHTGDNNTVTHSGTTYRHIHSASFSIGSAARAGKLAAYYMTNIYMPVLFVTCAEWVSQNHYGGASAVNTKTVLACENPVTLDYVACRDVISPHAAWLDPTVSNNTRDQIDGCIEGGIGDITNFEIVEYDYT